jgi:hypothetical protein
LMRRGSRSFPSPLYMCGAGHLGLFRPSGAGVSSMFRFGCGVAVLDSSGVAGLSGLSGFSGGSIEPSGGGSVVSSFAGVSCGTSVCGGVAGGSSEDSCGGSAGGDGDGGSGEGLELSSDFMLSWSCAAAPASLCSPSLSSSPLSVPSSSSSSDSSSPSSDSWLDCCSLACSTG